MGRSSSKSEETNKETNPEKENTIAEPKKKIYARATSNAQFVKCVDTLEAAGKTRTDIAAGLGISPSFLATAYKGSTPISKTLDVAAEGLLRRFGKGDEVKGRLIVSRVVLDHVDTFKVFVGNLGGQVVEEIHTLITDDKKATQEIALVIVLILESNRNAVEQLIKATGGEVRKVI